MRVRVLVRLKPGIMDVQGTAIQRALAGLGFTDVGDLRIGKVIELEVAGDSMPAVRSRVDEMCRKLLVNPILEHYSVEDLGDPAPGSDLAAPRAGR
jgi:phosphoribosylformylglycinamidine synthase PurS subunit